MEVDILNDLLNRSISNIFQNKSKHLSYLSFDEDEEFSSEYLEKQLTLDLNNKTQKPNQTNKSKSETLCTPELWQSTIGKKKFEESMKTLNLDTQKIKSKHITSMTLEQIQEEKAKVKSELKRYDADFVEVFKKAPTRHDKEVMKPLYIYYRALKNAIEKKKDEKTLTSTTPATGNTTDLNLGSLINNSTLSHIQGAGSFVQTNLNNIYMKSTVTQNNNTFSYHGRANSATNHIGNTNTFQVDPNIKKNNEKKRSLSKNEVVALEKEYFNIKKEQDKLKVKLHSFQAEFQRNNNRKVKFLKDITPVEKEYQQYKNNKNRLKEIKELIVENTSKNAKQVATTNQKIIK